MDPVSPIATAASALKTADETIATLGKIARWIKKFRYPKPRFGATGIIIALRTENDVAQTQVKNDFIAKFKELVEIRDSERRLQVIELPGHHIASIEADKDAERVLRRCKSQLIIWGIARERFVLGRPCIVVDFNPLAVHGEIIAPIRDIFAREMRELIPARAAISASNSLFEMEMTAEGVALAAQYLTAVAIYLSYNQELALKVFEHMHSNLSAIQNFPPGRQSHVKLFKNKIDVNIAYIRDQMASAEVINWRKYRDSKFLERMLEHVKVADLHVPNMYGSDNKKAMFHLEVSNDPKQALKVLEPWKASLINDGTWAANIAFLYLYSGNLAASSRFYKIAFRRQLKSSIVLELLEYMEWKVGQHPEKYEIYYGLGLTEIYCRGEIDSGQEYLRKFLNSVSKGQYQTQVKEVESILTGKIPKIRDEKPSRTTLKNKRKKKKK